MSAVAVVAAAAVTACDINNSHTIMIPGNTTVSATVVTAKKPLVGQTVPTLQRIIELSNLSDVKAVFSVALIIHQFVHNPSKHHHHSKLSDSYDLCINEHLNRSRCLYLLSWARC